MEEANCFLLFLKGRRMKELTEVEEVKLTYKNKSKACDRPKITCAEDAYRIFLSVWDEDQIELLEESKALFLDKKLGLMSVASISKGGFSETTIDLRLIFAIALKRRASSFILAHNHPSGILTPSRPDIQLTRQFQAAGKIMRIPLEDHLIITKDSFYSIVSER